jgi:hypothetical protein
MIRKYVESNNTCNKRARIEQPITTTYRLPLVPPWSKFTPFDVYISRLIGQYLLPELSTRRLDRELAQDIQIGCDESISYGGCCPTVHRFIGCPEGNHDPICSGCGQRCPGCDCICADGVDRNCDWCFY